MNQFKRISINKLNQKFIIVINNKYPVMEISILDNQHINETSRKDLDDRFGPNTFASHNHAIHSLG